MKGSPKDEVAVERSVRRRRYDKPRFHDAEFSAKRVADAFGQHPLCHTPLERSCPMCEGAKVRKSPAYRLEDADHASKLSFMDIASADLIGPIAEDVQNHACLLHTIGWCSYYPKVAPLKKNKESATVKDALVRMDPGYRKEKSLVFPKQLACDCGLEFKGEFWKYRYEMVFGHLVSLPYRPQTNAFVERFNLEVEHGTAAAWMQSCLQYQFWSFAALHWCFNNARKPGPRLGGVTSYISVCCSL